MQHKEHVSLIKELENMVRGGPAAGSFHAAYFQSCWALIKRIGPNFKDTPYPTRKERDASFGHFQTQVNHVKEQQAAFEKSSAAVAKELLDALEKARPPVLTMADIEGFASSRLGKPDQAPGEEEEESVEEPAVTLREHSELCNKILNTFMERRPLLSPADYKRVSEALRGVRQEIQAAFDTRKTEQRRRREERLAAAAAAGQDPADWRMKQERFGKKIKGFIQRDEDCLARETDVLEGLRKSVAGEKDPARLHRLQGLEEASVKNLEMIRAELQRNREVLANVERQLAKAQPQTPA